MRPAFCRALAIVLLAQVAPARAVGFTLPILGEDLDGTVNTALTVGAAVRMEDRAVDLVGKAALNPDVCGRRPDGSAWLQSCQGLFRDQTHPARALAAAPGQFSANSDDGNLNYDRHDLTQAVAKVTQDLRLTFSDYGLFAKWLYFYDFVNNDFVEHHPNRITAQNVDRVGYVDTTRSDSRPCPSDRRPAGAVTCSLVYGPGAPVAQARTDGEVLRQIGTDFQALEYYVYGAVALPFTDQQVTFKLGNQTVNWGESTVLLVNSLNQVNPLNTNNLGRVGFEFGDLAIPTGMLQVSAALTESAALEAIYQYEWEPTEIYAPGTFLSFIDLGSNNSGRPGVIGFGQSGEDPEAVGLLLDNPLSGLTNTTSQLGRVPDREASDSGQYGITLKYFAEWLGDGGTELGFYYLNYHSKFPLVSFFATAASCAKDATSLVELGAACPDVPTLHLPPNDPEGASSDVTPFDTSSVWFEYPEDLKLFGVSFSTNAGPWSIQGEIAYRPDAPLQVALVDLAFASFGPTLTNCHVADCAGSTGGSGAGENGGTAFYGASDAFADCRITASPCDTFDLGVGHVPGSGRSFPSFVVPYRGGGLGLNPATDFAAAMDRFNPGYIRGWETFDVYQFNVGGTHLQGASENVIGADQVIWIVELGAQWVPDLPDVSELQIEAPGQFTHASAGADGSGADGSRQACSTNARCVVGGDGLRFNPHQADLEGYADAFSYGVAVINLIRYESVLPGVSLAPMTIAQWDIHGTSTDTAAQFTQGRKDIALQLEIRYEAALALNVGYNWYTGGGSHNLQRDRDNLFAFVRYQF